MKVREVIKRLEAKGWYLARNKGSHRQYKHLDKGGTVTVAGNLGIDLPLGTLKSIWRQAQITEETQDTETTLEEKEWNTLSFLKRDG